MTRYSLSFIFAFSALCSVLLVSVAQADEADTALHLGGVGSLDFGFINFEKNEVEASDADTQLVGLQGALSIPFAELYSLQIDVLGEHTLDETDDNDQTIGNLIMAGHISYRDPSRFLVGLFGGGGWSFDGGDESRSITVGFVGAEAQAYFDDVTIYLQTGYADGEDASTENFEDAFMARGVASYYYTENGKFSAETSYLSGDRRNGFGGRGDLKVIGWSTRLEHLFDVPLLPNPAGISFTYNGYNYQASDESDSPMVHEFRVGFKFVFGSGSLINNDRHAAGLDLPPIHRWVSTATNEIK